VSTIFDWRKLNSGRFAATDREYLIFGLHYHDGRGAQSFIYPAGGQNPLARCAYAELTKRF
jgi:hypothetical protein